MFCLIGVFWDALGHFSIGCPSTRVSFSMPINFFFRYDVIQYFPVFIPLESQPRILTSCGEPECANVNGEQYGNHAHTPEGFNLGLLPIMGQSLPRFAILAERYCAKSL